MKNKLVFSLSIFFLLGVFSIVPTNKSNANKPVISEKAKVEVYYFHYTRRCATCQAVESEAKNDLDALYPALVKAGTIVFKSINLDEEGSTAIAETCKAEVQSLLIISGKKRFDLTENAFMYARSKPENIKKEIKKIIDPLVK